MKSLITTAIATTLLVSFSSFAAPGKDRGQDLTETLRLNVDSSAIKSDMQTTRIDQVVSSLASIAKDGTSAKGSASERALQVGLQTNEGALSGVEVAMTIIKSNAVLMDSTKVSNTLDKTSADKKASILSSNESYAKGMPVVISKIADLNSDGGKEIGKLVMMGREIAQGKLTADQARSYDEIMRSVTQLLLTKAASTSEQALTMALTNLGLSKEQVAQKLKDLLGCQV